MNAETSTQVADGTPKTKSLLRFVPTVVRCLMGLLFFASGVFFFLMFFHVVPEPTQPMPEGALAFSTALKNTGYMMPVVMGTQFLVGVLLLLNRFVPLALALIAPIIVGIVTFHLFLAPSGLGMAIFTLLMELYLAWAYRSAFRPMLAFRTKAG